ncbi:kinase-like protein [Zalerion maritima]|uniref:Kinase-like protein n=1 Tax=Zalerion maritima TaxID=339359 RepID=A0AAD5RT80_9PEZI|nr:kinase-like protein [Zalerion maritima]
MDPLGAQVKDGTGNMQSQDEFIEEDSNKEMSEPDIKRIAECFLGDFMRLGINDSYLPMRVDGFILVSTKDDMSNTKHWERRTANLLCTLRHSTPVPFFYRPADQGPHYVVSKFDKLPFLEIEALDRGDDEEGRCGTIPTNDGEGVATARILGGAYFADTSQFNNFPLRRRNKSFAMKRLMCNNWRIFAASVMASKQLAGRYKHLMPPILTFEQENGGNPLDSKRQTNLPNPKWLIGQACGLSEALFVIRHAHEEADDSTIGRFTELGRHGRMSLDGICLFDDYEGIEYFGPMRILTGGLASMLRPQERRRWK